MVNNRVQKDAERERQTLNVGPSMCPDNVCYFWVMFEKDTLSTLRRIKQIETPLSSPKRPQLRGSFHGGIPCTGMKPMFSSCSGA